MRCHLHVLSSVNQMERGVYDVKLRIFRPKQAMAGLRKAADLIAHGDTIERCIRSTGSWKLLNEQVFCYPYSAFLRFFVVSV